VYIVVLQYITEHCVASVERLSSEIDDIEPEKYVSLFPYDMWTFLFVDIEGVDKCMNFFATGVVIFVYKIYFFCYTIIEIVNRKWLVCILMDVKSIK